MSRVGRYERGTYVLCVRLGAGSAHGCAHCTMQRGNCMHAESPMRLRCVSPCGDAFDRRRSTSVDGARGELGSSRFPVNALTNPSGLLGTDGQIYVITSGESSALDSWMLGAGWPRALPQASTTHSQWRTSFLRWTTMRPSSLSWARTAQEDASARWRHRPRGLTRQMTECSASTPVI